MNIANTLTIARFFFVIPIVSLLSVKDVFLNSIAGVIFVIASVTDIIDGIVARTRGEVTDFGKLIDPLADKFLLIGAVVSLVGIGDIPSWIAVILILREFFVTFIRIVALQKGKVISSGFWGKVKTVVYAVSLSAFMFNYKKIGTVILYFGVLLAIISALIYTFENKDYIIGGDT